MRRRDRKVDHRRTEEAIAAQRAANQLSVFVTSLVRTAAQSARAAAHQVANQISDAPGCYP
jgi:hypothetical protein